MINRRNLLIALSTTLFTPRIVFSQAKKPPVVIGWLHTESRETHGRYLVAFKEELAALGWKEGTNYVLEERWANGQLNRTASTLTGELVAKKPAVVVTASASATSTAARAAPSTPIVQADGGSPVNTGFAKSLARPGGMVTGVINVSSDIAEKFLELLLAAVPRAKRFGFLVDAKNVNAPRYVEQAQRAAKHYSVEARIVELTNPEEFELAMSRLANEGVQGLIVTPLSGRFGVGARRILEFALARRWPVIAGSPLFSEEGALLVYSAERFALYRRTAHYVDRILKGAKPADLPIEQPMRFDMVVNLKTAKALGLTMPPEIMVQATQVIQ